MTLQELHILLSARVREQIEERIGADPMKIALEKNLPHAGLIATQIKYLSRARTKLPAYYQSRCIIPSLAFEQSSSQTCAETLVRGGRLCVDLTCGLGIDSMYLSRNFERVIAVERDEVLSAVAKENFARLGITNIEVVNDTAENFLQSFTGHADMIYADPDRRDEGGRKMVLLQDCSPDILALLPALRAAADNLTVKLSPMFDTAEAIRIFGPDARISALSESGECKQLTVECGADTEGCTLTAVMADRKQEISFAADDTDAAADDTFSPERYRYLIVPDVSLAKIRCVRRYLSSSGAFSYSENGYGFARQVPSSPFGRVLEIESIEPFSPKSLKTQLRRQGIRQADIMRREFPLSAQQIAAQLGIRQGGKLCMCFTQINGQMYQIKIR